MGDPSDNARINQNHTTNGASAIGYLNNSGKSMSSEMMRVVRSQTYCVAVLV